MLLWWCQSWLRNWIMFWIHKTREQRWRRREGKKTHHHLFDREDDVVLEVDWEEDVRKQEEDKRIKTLKNCIVFLFILNRVVKKLHFEEMRVMVMMMKVVQSLSELKLTKKALDRSRRRRRVCRRTSSSRPAVGGLFMSLLLLRQSFQAVFSEK